MPDPHFYGSRRFVPASKLVDATGEALLAIKDADNLTWREIGDGLGVGEDQATRYAKGNSEMGFTTWLRGCHLWNGRFSVAAQLSGFALSQHDNAIRRQDVQRGMLSLTLVIADLQRAMIDGDLGDDELEAMDGVLDQADHFLAALQKRLAEIRASRAQVREP